MLTRNKKGAEIKLGDRFLKIGAFSSVWRVARMLDLHGLPPHFHLEPENSSKSIRTFSISALLDSSLFQRLDAGSGAH